MSTQTITTIECHVAGHSVRFVTDGIPRALGRGPLERSRWFGRHADHLRQALVLEPRGHPDLIVVALTEAASPEAHAGLLFMDAGGYPKLAVGAVAAAARVCLARGLIVTGEPPQADRTLVFETPVGLIRTRTPAADDGADVVVDIGPAFVRVASRTVTRGARRVPIDVAFGGDFFAIVDSEAAGVPLDRAHSGELRRVALELCEEIDARCQLTHPVLPGPQALAGIVLTGPATSERAHLRSVVVSRHGVVDRSSLSGSAAVLAVLDGMGLVVEGVPFAHEGLSGLTVEATAVGRSTVGDVPALDVEVRAQVWVTGEQTWLLSDGDPLRCGERAEPPQ